MSYQTDVQAREIIGFSVNESSKEKAFEVIFTKVNIFQKNHHVIAQMDLDGIDPDDVRVMVSTKSLVLYLKKSHNGDLVRVVSLPTEVNADLAEADYQDGLLTVSAPKAAQSKEVFIQRKDR